jgi:hypothetical protein
VRRILLLHAAGACARIPCLSAPEQPHSPIASHSPL